MSNDTINRQLLFDVNFYSSIVLTAIGMIGNPLVIYIFTRPQFLKVSMFHYWIAETIADILNILCNWPSVFPDFFNLNELSISCKIFYYFYYVPYQVSPWMLSLSSIDRVLSVKYPTTSRFRNNVKYQLIAIIAVVVFISLVNTPIYWYHDAVPGQGCVTTDHEIEIYLDILNLLLGAIIPFVIMTVSTCLIWQQLLMKKKNLKQENKKRYHKDVQLIKILCIMDIYFLVLNLPYAVYVVICDILHIKAFDTLALYITANLAYAFAACNFFIYIIFNKVFLDYFISMIICWKKNRYMERKSVLSTDIAY